MPELSDAAEADRLSRRRARMMPPLALILVVQQGAFAVAEQSPRRAVDYVSLVSWLVLAGVILAALASGGFWRKSRAVRALMDDEVTRDNRGSALTLGFVLAMAVAMGLYLVDFFEPMSARIAIHIVVTTGLAAALLRFAVLERRALG